MTDIDWELLTRYLADDCDDLERRDFERWMAESPTHRAMLDAARRVAPDADVVAPVGRRDAVLASLRREIAVSAPTFVLPTRRRWAGVLRAAAAIAVLIGGALIWRYLPRNPVRAASSAAVLRELATGPGQRLSVRLADGTAVTLGPSSTLRHDSAYGIRDRVVQLEGEAVFTVTHDATRPFAVHTHAVIARDIGTRFVVRAYPNDSLTDVVVAEGIVAVARREKPADTAVITRGERIQVGGAGLTQTRNVSLPGYFDWAEGRLVFEGTPLRDALPRLARWYNVDVRLLSPAAGSRRLTAAFDEESAPDALRTVAATLDLALSGSGHDFILRSR